MALYIYDKYLLTNLLTACHVGIGGVLTGGGGGEKETVPEHDTDR